jgi:hypothetical protein
MGLQGADSGTGRMRRGNESSTMIAMKETCRCPIHRNLPESGLFGDTEAGDFPVARLAPETIRAPGSCVIARCAFWLGSWTGQEAAPESLRVCLTSTCKEYTRSIWPCIVSSSGFGEFRRP